MIKVRNKFISY